MKEDVKNTIKTINSNKLAVVPTDTILGIVCNAFDRDTVFKLYKVRNRSLSKPCIVLLSSVDCIFSKFYISKDRVLKNILGILWNDGLNNVEKKIELGKTSFENILKKIDLNRNVSVVLNCPSEKYSHIHLKTNTIAFRVPSVKNLNGMFIREVLAKTNPIIAPSANLEGKKFSKNIADANKYFGNKVSCYIENLDYLDENASHVIQYNNKVWKVLR